MIREFLRDRGGNYAMLMGIAMLPIMGSVAIAIDFSEMNRQKQATINALDAAGVATARQVVSGASNEALIAYANEFFKANLGPVDPDDTELTVVLPNNQFGGGTLKLSAVLNYEPYFLPSFLGLLGKPADERDREISFAANSEIRLKNTLEVALVLDNSTLDERIRLRLRPEAHGAAQDGGQAARRHAGAAGRPDQAGRKAGAVLARPLRGLRQRRAGQRRRRMDGRRGSVAGSSRKFRLVDA